MPEAQGPAVSTISLTCFRKSNLPGADQPQPLQAWAGTDSQLLDHQRKSSSHLWVHLLETQFYRLGEIVLEFPEASVVVSEFHPWLGELKSHKLFGVAKKRLKEKLVYTFHARLPTSVQLLTPVGSYSAAQAPLYHEACAQTVLQRRHAVAWTPTMLPLERLFAVIGLLPNLHPILADLCSLLPTFMDLNTSFKVVLGNSDHFGYLTVSLRKVFESVCVKLEGYGKMVKTYYPSAVLRVFRGWNSLIQV